MKIMTAIAGIRDRFAQFIQARRISLPRSISDHQARDIGLSSVELERHRFVWPSESKDRPLL